MGFVRFVRPLTAALSGLAAIGAAFAQGPEDSTRSFETPRDLLVALERSDRDIEALEADIQYIRRFLLQGDEHVRGGRLYFSQQQAEGDAWRRRFGVHFDVLYLGGLGEGDGGVREENEQVFIFDGEWLIEKRPQHKQYVARQIAPPDADFDPLRLGEGPIPFPIGQRADDVLERFEAELLSDIAGLDDEPTLRASAAGRLQLRLTPRRFGQGDDDFQEIRIWYDVETLLPRMAFTVNRAGDESIVQLINVKRVSEGDLPADALSIAQPREEEGWETQIELFRGDDREPAAGGE